MELMSLDQFKASQIQKRARSLEDDESILIVGDEGLLKVERLSDSFQMTLVGKSKGKVVSYQATTEERISMEKACMYFSTSQVKDMATALSWEAGDYEVDGAMIPPSSEFMSRFASMKDEFGGEQGKQQREKSLVQGQQKKQAEEKKASEDKAKRSKSNSPLVICPHCDERGYVETKKSYQKNGISGSKATAAVLTAGLSVLATGLSSKGLVTKAHCHHCGIDWII